MIDPHNVPAVDEGELLARYILTSRHIRGSNDTVKPEAFIPHPHTELSVTRHRDATEQEIWEIGRAIAAYQGHTLHGRGDVSVRAFSDRDLSVVADPVLDDTDLPDNPNHATVTGWPKDDKAQQRLLALEIAAQAQLVRTSD